MVKQLTEKRLRNRRFKTTEEAILLACYRLKDSLSPSHLARSAHISRSTFYRHHENVGHIASDYEYYIYRKTRATLVRLLKMKRVCLRVIYERLLIMISVNGDIFTFLLEFGDSDFLDRIILILEPRILSATRLGSGEEALNVYVSEVTSLIKTWCTTNFDRTEIPILAGKIMYLTDTASLRLRPLSQIGHKHDD